MRYSAEMAVCIVLCGGGGDATRGYRYCIDLLSYAMQTGAKTTVRDFKLPYDVETLKQQPMLAATLDPAAVDQLYRQLECQLGRAYNCRSFDSSDCGGSSATLTSPLSTLRVNTTSTSSLHTDDAAAAAAEDRSSSSSSSGSTK